MCIEKTDPDTLTEEEKESFARLGIYMENIFKLKPKLMDKN